MNKPKVEKFGEKHLGLVITGNPKNCEVEMYSIRFPGGEVNVTRAVDGDPETDYWVHVSCNNPGTSYYTPYDGDIGEVPSRFVDARLDQTDKHASESNLGDFERPELYHVALRVSRKTD